MILFIQNDFIGEYQNNYMIKTGDLREDSHADDNYAKKAKYAGKDGNSVLADKVAGDEDVLSPNEKTPATDKVLHNNAGGCNCGKS